MDNETNQTVPYNKSGEFSKEDLCDIFLDVSLWIALLSFIINSFNIFAVFPSDLSSKLCYRLVINLSFSDALLDLVMIIYLGTKKTGVEWSHELFYFISTVFDVCSLVSLWTLIAMSFDLFMLMIYPLKYMLLTDTLAFRAVVIYIWIISVIPYILLEVVAAAVSKVSNTSLLETVITDGFRSNCINSFCAIFGFIIILVLYFKIFQDIYSLKKRLPSDSMSLIKSALTISLVVLAYFICYMPLWMYVFVEIIFDTDLSDDERGFVLECLAYLLHVVNTLCDPIIYAFRIPIIRKVYCKPFQKLRGFFQIRE